MAIKITIIIWVVFLSFITGKSNNNYHLLKIIIIHIQSK